MKRNLTHTKQQGFTTVELMVTLVVASLFILSGYQLYGAMNMRSSAVRYAAEASNIGYEVLRKEGSDYLLVSNTCTSTPAVETVTRTSTTLKNLAITLERCKPFADSDIIQSTVVVKYNVAGTTQEVRHATYISS